MFHVLSDCIPDENAVKNKTTDHGLPTLISSFVPDAFSSLKIIGILYHAQLRHANCKE